MNKLNVLRKKNKSNLISIAVLCFLLVVAVTLSGTLAYFSDKGKIEGIQIVTFGVVDLNTPTNGFVYTQGVDFNKLYPGSNFEVTGGIKSLSTGDFYIYMEPKMSLQKLVGSDWLDLGDIYMGEQDENEDWHETTTKAFTFSSIDIIGTISRTGTEKLFSTYATNASSIGWGEQSGLALNEGNTEFANGLYVVNVNSAATFANGTAPTNNASYEHTLEMKCDVDFDFLTPNVVFYTTDNTNYTELVLNDPANENNFRFNFSIEFRAMQQANMIGATGNLPNVFSADESWATPVTAGTKDLKDVYDFLRIEPLFTGEYKQWDIKYDSDANGSLDADCWTMAGGILSTVPAWRTYLGTLTDVEVYIPGYFQVSGRYTQVDALSYSAFGKTTYSPDDAVKTITSVKFGNGVKSIQNGSYQGWGYVSAFGSCSGLTSITIPNSVTSVGSASFAYCSGLTSISIPNGVTRLEVQTFYSCSSLTSITIPNSVTNIGNQTFYGCSALTSIIIPNNVINMGNQAFSDCTALTNITIGNSVASIGEEAFYSCSGLTSINVESNNANFNSTGNCLINTATKTLIVGCKTSVIPSDGSVTSIGNKAFYNCTGLTGILTIPDSVTSIGASAFVSCTGLTSVTIPNSVTIIGGSAFHGCSGLTSITLGNSITSIGGFAFFNCTGLTSITLPNSVTSIGSSVFKQCTGVTSITIPNNLISIGDNAFYDCSGLTSVTFENTVGWKAGTTPVIVTDAAQNATYLKTTYASSAWTRS